MRANYLETSKMLYNRKKKDIIYRKIKGGKYYRETKKYYTKLKNQKKILYKKIIKNREK